MTGGYDGPGDPEVTGATDDADADAADDRALRSRLRATDPALSLPPAGPDRLTRLLEEIMDTETATEQPPARETGARGRSPLTWLVAAAAVLLIAGAALFGVLRNDEDPGGGVPAAAPDRTITKLSAPDRSTYAARCMPPSAVTLSHQTLAFDGTVRSIEDGLVTLVPSHFYSGHATDLVTVQAPPSALEALLGAVEFEQGGRYLVSATGGTVAVCGLSARWSPDLAALYHRAFEGG